MSGLVLVEAIYWRHRQTRSKVAASSSQGAPLTFLPGSVGVEGSGQESVSRFTT